MWPESPREIARLPLSLLTRLRLILLGHEDLAGIVFWAALVGIGAVDEGEYRAGQWIARRRLNGDENDQGRCWRFSNQGIAIERCTVYRSK